MFWFFVNLLNFVNFKLIPLCYTFQIYYCHSAAFIKDEAKSGRSVFNNNLTREEKEETKIGKGKTDTTLNVFNTFLRTPQAFSRVGNTEVYTGILPSSLVVRYFMYFVKLGIITNGDTFWTGRENGEKNIVLYLNSLKNSTRGSPDVSCQQFDETLNINTQLQQILQYWIIFISYSFIIKPVISFIGLGIMTNTLFESLLGVSLVLSLSGNLFVKGYNADNFLNDVFELFIQRLIVMYDLINTMISRNKNMFPSILNDGFFVERLYSFLPGFGDQSMEKRRKNNKDVKQTVKVFDNSDASVVEDEKSYTQDAYGYSYGSDVINRSMGYFSSFLKYRNNVADEKTIIDTKTHSNPKNIRPQNLKIQQDYEIVNDFIQS